MRPIESNTGQILSDSKPWVVSPDFWQDRKYNSLNILHKLDFYITKLCSEK